MWRWLLLLLLCGCGSALELAPPVYRGHGQVLLRETRLNVVGGGVELTLVRDGDSLAVVAHNHLAAPVVLAWQVSWPEETAEGVTLVPAADGAEYLLLRRRASGPASFRVRLHVGDPRARPTPYAYAWPFARGERFTVTQGFHAPGHDAYAIDVACPVGTSIRAMRPGLVVATNLARGAGTGPEFKRLDHSSFVLVLHDDGTLAIYGHLSGLSVAPGTQVARGQEVGLSGNVGYSTGPHLHVEIMTSSADGEAQRSFPFVVQVGPGQAQAPSQGQTYQAWE